MTPFEHASSRPTWAEIDLDALAQNLDVSRRFIGSGIKVMAMVKADAYGHGAVECAQRLEKEDIDWLGVALPEEGFELRQAGISKPILCVGGVYPGQAELVVGQRITPVVYNLDQGSLLDTVSRERQTVTNVHIKIDTGMGRVGIRFDQLGEFIPRLASLKNLRVEGLMTHFAAADDLGQNDFTTLQIQRFDDAVAAFRSKGFDPEFIDLANSPGAVAHPESRGNMVRLGGILYGLGGDVLPDGIPKPDLHPVMSLFSRIAHLKQVPANETLGYGRTFRTKRDSLIATLPIGYHDGYRRDLSNRGRVIINDTYAPVVGRISMDWTIVDVTDVPNVKMNDKVTVIGRSKGLEICAEELAHIAGTISYEITCGINRRVPKHFVEASGIK